jgi:hypothetical protein
MLEGRLPGVQIMSDNSPEEAHLFAYAFSTINNNDPLVIIDGVPASNGLNEQSVRTLSRFMLKDALLHLWF